MEAHVPMENFQQFDQNDNVEPMLSIPQIPVITTVGYLVGETDNSNQVRLPSNTGFNQINKIESNNLKSEAIKMDNNKKPFNSKIKNRQIISVVNSNCIKNKLISSTNINNNNNNNNSKIKSKPIQSSSKSNLNTLYNDKINVNKQLKKN